MSSELQREPPPELRARLLAAVAERPAPSRREQRLRSAALAASAVLLPLAVFVGMGSAEQGPRSWALVAVTAAGTFVLAAAALSLALARGRRLLGLPSAWLVSVAVACPAAFAVWKLVWSSAFGEMMLAWPERPGLRCFGLSLAFGLWPLVALALARRGSDPVHPRSLGAALGAASGLWAGTLVDLWCPVGYPQHVLLGHVLPMLLLSALGAVAGARLLGLPR
jgi:hypothetical protein